MTNKEILKKLKSINEINPDERWVSKNRSDLLLQIKDSCPAVQHGVWNKIFVWLKLNFGFLADLVIPKRFVDVFARPLAVSFVGAMIVFSTMATMGMAQDAIPGDILYPVKIVGENVQLALTADIESKTRIEMEFAGRRVKELNKLVAQNKLSVSDLVEKVNKATSKLQKNINTVNIHLAELEKTGEVKDVLKVAKDIDKKISEYAIVLNKINENALVNTKSKVAEALNQAEEVGDKALEVIIAKHKGAEDGISDLEIAEKLNNKIALTVGDAEKGEDSKIQNEELDKTIQDARDLIQTGDFAAALNKITEGKDIIKELRAKMEEEEKQKYENNETQKQDGESEEEIEKLRNSEIDGAETQDEVEEGADEAVEEAEEAKL